MPPKKKTAARGGPAAKKPKIQKADSEEDVQEDSTPTQDGLKKQPVAVLRDTCAQLGLDGKGTKDAMIQRILQHHEAQNQTAPSGVKLVKQESKNTQIRRAFESLKNDAPAPKSTAKVDQEYKGSANCKVHEDYACTLNQTNIGQNNNKFYLIQLIEETSGKKGSVYHVFTRWGRVGEIGQKSTSSALTLDKAIAEYEKKFKDKTKNVWDERADFVAHKGKYTLLEIDDDDGDDTETDGNQSEVKPKVEIVGGRATAKCTLDSKTRDLIEMLFDKDMFNNAMQVMELDVKKMPLGKLSKTQIAKGFEVLVAIEEAINEKKNRQVLAELSSKFYTLIPHNFGRRTPTVMDTSMIVQQKKDVLLVLSDIELTQSLQKVSTKLDSDQSLEPHPIDVNYKLLNCGLSLVPLRSKEYEVIQKYYEETKPTWAKHRLCDVWKVDRMGEDERFRHHDSIKERKLLWHGTNVAVVAAILSSGLRIMPHSGGRVGQGIYFASENSKSACYVGCAPKGEGIMFLNEVVLGKEKTITKDNSSLKKAPAGFHSVVARGQKEPDPKFDVKLDIDGKKVVVPQAKPIITEFKDSYFDQSEYLVYEESQVRIRYLLMIQMR